MRNIFHRPRARVVEATPAQMVSTGAWAGAGYDPVDGDLAYRRSGASRREVPYWTREKAVAASIAAYRSNPMATAIVDTYTAFCVGDSGVTYQCVNEDVRKVVEEFWNDPKNRIGKIQTLELRTQMLLGEYAQEMLVGANSGAVRFSPMDPQVIEDVELDRGNPLWPARLVLRQDDAESGDKRRIPIVQVNDETGLREGRALFWTPWKTLATDVRGMPFLTSILDDLDAYDQVISNLIDRTALARYLVWTVKVAGNQDDVDAYVRARGGMHIPSSGTVEVHNESVEWTPQSAPSGAAEDTQTAGSVLTKVAGGAGLARTWLADPEDSNRATSFTMAEPVRRRVGGVQSVWLDYQTERVQFAIDQAVAAKRLSPTVEAVDPKTGAAYELPAAQAVTVTGPEIAAADSQIAAQVMLNLATGLEKLKMIGALSDEGANVAAKKAWEEYMGVPWRSDLDGPTTNPDDLATAVEEAARNKHLRLARAT